MKLQTNSHLQYYYNEENMNELKTVASGNTTINKNYVQNPVKTVEPCHKYSILRDSFIPDVPDVWWWKYWSKQNTKSQKCKCYSTEKKSNKIAENYLEDQYMVTVPGKKQIVHCYKIQ